MSVDGCGTAYYSHTFYILGPLDEELKEILRGYNRSNITSYQEIQRRLADKHHTKIG